MSRVMGIDLGERRIGIAVSDPNGTLASGIKVLQRINLAKDLENIKKLAVQEEVNEIIMGLPLSLNGHHGPQASITKEFGELLAQNLNIPIKFWDERLTTVEAEHHLRLSGVKKNQWKDIIDMVSAQLILQSYLDYNINRTNLEVDNLSQETN